MLPLATHSLIPLLLPHPFYFVLFKFKDLVTKQLSTNTDTDTVPTCGCDHCPALSDLASQAAWEERNGLGMRV